MIKSTYEKGKNIYKKKIAKIALEEDDLQKCSSK